MDPFIFECYTMFCALREREREREKKVSKEEDGAEKKIHEKFSLYH